LCAPWDGIVVFVLKTFVCFWGLVGCVFGFGFVLGVSCCFFGLDGGAFVGWVLESI